MPQGQQARTSESAARNSAPRRRDDRRRPPRVFPAQIVDLLTGRKRSDLAVKLARTVNAMVFMSNGHGYCAETNRAIGRFTHQSLRTINRHVAILERIGIISETRTVSGRRGVHHVERFMKLSFECGTHLPANVALTGRECGTPKSLQATSIQREAVNRTWVLTLESMEKSPKHTQAANPHSLSGFAGETQTQTQTLKPEDLVNALQQLVRNSTGKQRDKFREQLLQAEERLAEATGSLNQLLAARAAARAADLERTIHGCYRIIESPAVSPTVRGRVAEQATQAEQELAALRGRAA